MLGCVDQVTRAEPSTATDGPVSYLLAEIKQPCFVLLASCLLSSLKALCLTLFIVDSILWISTLQGLKLTVVIAKPGIALNRNNCLYMNRCLAENSHCF